MQACGERTGVCGATHFQPLATLGLSGRDGLVGAPVQLAIPNTIVADLSSARAFDLRE